MYLLNRTVKSTDFALYTGFMMSGTSAEFLSVKFSKGKDTWAQWKCLELGKKKKHLCDYRLLSLQHFSGTWWLTYWLPGGSLTMACFTAL